MTTSLLTFFEAISLLTSSCPTKIYDHELLLIFIVTFFVTLPIRVYFFWLFRINHVTDFLNKNSLCLFLNKIFTVLCHPWPYYLSLTSKLANVFGSTSHLTNFLSVTKNHFTRIDSEATCPSLELTDSEGVKGTESHRWEKARENYLLRALYPESCSI